MIFSIFTNKIISAEIETLIFMTTITYSSHHLFLSGLFTRRIVILAGLLLIIVSDGFCQLTDEEVRNRPTLNEAAQWIRENVRFPQDAQKYGIVGTERFVISADWEGRIFITSPLHVLNPTIEQSIKEAVARAPRCRFAGNSADDIYASVEIDFAGMIPESEKTRFIEVSEHTFPAFPNQKAREDSREKFVEWLSERYLQTKKTELHGYVDTVMLHYSIAANGKPEKVSVTDCRDERLRKELEQTMRKSPKWTPAISSEYIPLAVSIRDRIVVRTDANGTKHPLVLLRDEVCRNSALAPTDPNCLVPNPEVKPRLLGEYANLGRMLAEQVEFDVLTEYACSFVIERDGSVSELQIETTDENIGRTIAKKIRQTRWSPAMQGGSAVRTNYRLHEKRGPHRQYEVVSEYAPFISQPRFMTEGRYAPFVYDRKEQQRRWKRFKQAYPEAEATIHGYGEFRKLDNLEYTEALSRRNALQPAPKTKRKTKK